jgi:hypothetical protein
LSGCQSVPTAAPVRPENVVVAPLLGRTGAHLTVRDAASRIQVTMATLPGLLYRITTPAGAGLAPVATVRDGRAEVRFRPTGGDGPDDVRIVLNRDVRWELGLPAGAGETDLDLAAGQITRLTAGGSGLVEASLPTPAGTLPVIFGDVGSAIVNVPPGPARMRLSMPSGPGAVDTPWGPTLIEPGWAGATQRYAVSFRSGPGRLTVRRSLL